MQPRDGLESCNCKMQDEAASPGAWGAQVEVTPGSVGGAFELEAVGDVYDRARTAFEAGPRASLIVSGDQVKLLPSTW